MVWTISSKHDSKVVERKVGKDFLITPLLANIQAVMTTGEVLGDIFGEVLSKAM